MTGAADQLSDLRATPVIRRTSEQRLAQRGSEPLADRHRRLAPTPIMPTIAENYVCGVVQSWRVPDWTSEQRSAGRHAGTALLVQLELESRRALIPGAIAIVMTFHHRQLC